MPRTISSILFATLASLTLIISGAQAQTFRAASEQAENDLRAALDELATTRDHIASEKIPLMTDHNF